MKILRISLLIFFTILANITVAQDNFDETKIITEGFWRGVFQTTNGEVPFNFEVKGNNLDKLFFYLKNGKECVSLKASVINGDSLFVPVELYEAILAIKFTKNSLSGVYKKVNTTKPDAGIPFTAEHGKKYRFTEAQLAPKADLSGKWEVDFLLNEKDVNKTVGIFEQKGNYLTGTILTTTGDYRYLEGTVQGDEFFLSAFSGSNPTLVKGKITDKEGFTGTFNSLRGSIKFVGKKNENAALPDAYSLTYLKEGYKTLDFSFPDLNGKNVSLKDEKYKDKVVIVTILGTWCPNCIDETAFLAPWYQENKQKGVEIIGLAYERKDDFAYAKTALNRLKNRFNVEYDLLFAGVADKKVASQSLPALNAVLSFPTTILIDKKGNVAKIHTGFTGPATGKYYEDFINEFNADVANLLNGNSLENLQKTSSEKR